MTLAAGGLVDFGDFPDTGPVSMSSALETGFTSSSLEVRRIGDMVTWQGTIAPTTNWGTANTTNNTVLAVGDITAEFCPSQNQVFITPTNAATVATVFRVAITTTGSMAIRCDTSTHTSAVYVCVTYPGAAL